MANKAKILIVSKYRSLVLSRIIKYNLRHRGIVDSEVFTVTDMKKAGIKLFGLYSEVPLPVIIIDIEGFDRNKEGLNGYPSFLRMADLRKTILIPTGNATDKEEIDRFKRKGLIVLSEFFSPKDLVEKIKVIL